MESIVGFVIHRKFRTDIPPEVAHRLDQILLIVLQPVVIEIHLTSPVATHHPGILPGVGIAHTDGLGIVDVVARTVGRIHTVLDVRIARDRGNGIGTDEVDLPRIAQAVPVGIHCAGVQTAATEAGVDTVIRRGSVLQDRAKAGRRRTLFLPIRQTVTVGILTPRVGRPELVDPGLILAGTVDGDLADHLLTVHRPGVERGVVVMRRNLGTGELTVVREPVEHVVVVGRLGRVGPVVAVVHVPRAELHVGTIRTARHIEFPAVRQHIVAERAVRDIRIAVRRQRAGGGVRPVLRTDLAAAVHDIGHELAKQELVRRGERPRLIGLAQAGTAPRDPRIEAELLIDLEVENHDLNVIFDAENLSGLAEDLVVRDRMTQRDRAVFATVGVTRPEAAGGLTFRRALRDVDGLDTINLNCHELAGDGGIGHPVTVRIVVGVVDVRIDRIGAHQGFPAVRHAVAIGIPLDRVGPERELLKIGQPVIIRIGIGGHRGQGVKLLLDRFRLDDDRPARIGRIVTMADAVLDAGEVPEVVLVTVRQPVVVRIGFGRVGPARFGTDRGARLIEIAIGRHIAVRTAADDRIVQSEILTANLRDGIERGAILIGHVDFTVVLHLRIDIAIRVGLGQTGHRVKFDILVRIAGGDRRDDILQGGTGHRILVIIRDAVLVQVALVVEWPELTAEDRPDLVNAAGGGRSHRDDADRIALHRAEQVSRDQAGTEVIPRIEEAVIRTLFRRLVRNRLKRALTRRGFENELVDVVREDGRNRIGGDHGTASQRNTRVGQPVVLRVGVRTNRRHPQGLGGADRNVEPTLVPTAILIAGGHHNLIHTE